MVKTIARDELVKMRAADQKVKVVDVLPRESYEQEHIQGAISLPLGEIDENAAGLLNKEETIVVYCASFECQASTKAAEKLQALGYKKALDYKGGLKDYKEGNLPLEGSLHQGTGKAACAAC